MLGDILPDGGMASDGSCWRLWADDRAVAEQLGYLFNLGLLLVFLGATIPMLGQFNAVAVQAQQQQAEAEAQRVAGGLQTVDRLVRSSTSTGEIGRHYNLAKRIGQNRYTITIKTSASGPDTVIIETRASDVRVTASFETTTPVKETTVKGGEIFIVRPDGATKIQVKSEGRP